MELGVRNAFATEACVVEGFANMVGKLTFTAVAAYPVISELVLAMTAEMLLGLGEEVVMKL
jgi:hypothetical protein